MSNSGINKNLNNVISTLNKKADTNLANSAKATEIENIANSAASAAQSAATVAHAASELINTALPQKVNKNGDIINGNLIVDGNMTVTGEINATITGSSESAMSATKDSNGNVIVDTYATKNDIIGVVRSVNGVNADASGNVDAVSSMIPDYTAGITLSSITSYIAPAAGLIIWKTGSSGINGSFSGGELKVNGSLVDMSSQYNYSAEIGVTTVKQAFVDKSDVVTFNRSASPIFYPCKGAV